MKCPADGKSDTPPGIDAASDDANRSPADDRFVHALALMEGRRYEDAARLFDEILRDDRRDGEAYQQRAIAMLNLGKPRAALSDAELAVRYSPDDSDSYRVRGWANFDLKHYERATADFSRYLRQEDVSGCDPARVAAIYYFRGRAYARMKDLRQALKDFTRAITNWPQWSEPYLARAEIYERQGKMQQAQADRDEAARRAAKR